MLRKSIVTGIILLFLLSSIIPIASSNLNNEWIYNEDTGTWSIEFSGELEESFILKYVLIETSQVGVIYSHEYSFPEDSKGYIEASYNRGESWNVVKEYNESSTNVRDLFVSLTLGSLWVRFTVESYSGNGYWRIMGIDLIGDTKGTPPYSWAESTGPWKYWFSYSISFTICAFDDASGVREIHYVLDRQETVIPGYVAPVTISANGIYDFAFWAVDNRGNEEVPHIIRPFGIDREYPIVRIKSPETGLYIFGKKISLPINKTIIVGGFNIGATAYDNVSGIYKIIYELDGKIINLATEEPYVRYCGIKHNGKGLLTIIAEDYAGNTAEDTIEIYYYNFF